MLFSLENLKTMVCLYSIYVESSIYGLCYPLSFYNIFI